MRYYVAIMFYILGLGNPGAQYEKTRHNVGRNVLLRLQTESGFADWQKSKHANALYSRGELNSQPVELLLPETFMNKSGDTVRYVIQKHNATPEEFIVIYDDVDLPLGEFKISSGRGDGGHNGIKSIIQALKSKDFIRIRIGVARKSFWTGKTIRPGGVALNKHVLGKFTSGEEKRLTALYTEMLPALELLINEGVEKAMNTYNR